MSNDFSRPASPKPSVPTIMHLNQQNRGAGGLALFEVAVGLRGVLERVGLPRRDLYGAGTDHIEQLVRGLDQIVARRRVMDDRGPRKVEPALLIEYHRVDRRHHARGVADEERPFWRGDTAARHGFAGVVMVLGAEGKGLCGSVILPR